MIFKNSHIIPNLEDWPVNKLYENRDAFITSLNQHVVDNFSEADLESTLQKTIYREKKRVKFNRWNVDPADDEAYWNAIEKGFNEAKSSENTDQYWAILERIVNRYNQEIVATFVPKTFKLFRKLLTVFFKIIYNDFWNRWSGFWGNRKSLINQLRVVGDVDRLRSLFPNHTIVMLPTHQSNLDSPVVGYTIDTILGIPTFLYGAGLNLFNYEFIAIAMSRLGTYKVDRRKRNAIYMSCLTSMLVLSLEKRTNNIFFPGGTRARDGRIEQNLKTGLLGAVVEAQRQSFVKEDNNKIIIFPVNTSFHFTFEAKSLIDQHLKKSSEGKYIKEKPQKKISGYYYKLVKQLFSKKSDYVFSLGAPMDVFGNSIDDDGNSLDQNGEVFDIKGYFELDGVVTSDPQREKVYANKLAEKVADAYRHCYVVLTSHFVAYLAFQYLVYKNPSNELLEILNLSKEDLNIPMEDFKLYTERFLELLRKYESEGELILSEELKTFSPEEIIDDGLKQCGVYHAVKVIYTQKGFVKSDNFRLLHYYHNRLDTYNMDMSPIFY